MWITEGHPEILVLDTHEQLFLQPRVLCIMTKSLRMSSNLSEPGATRKVSQTKGEGRGLKRC